MSYLDLSMEEIHNALKNKEVKPSTLVKEALDRAHRYQKDYNAFVTILDESLKVAESMDDDFSDNIFFGMPIAIKDNYSTNGILSTASSNMLKDYVPVYDATVVKKLKNAKAINIGKTVLDELAMGGTGANGHSGVTHNPYNVLHQSGGSSGGSAAAVSLGIVPFALGSDTGDSVRKPASLCGIVGFKPSWGRISRYGLFPFAPSLDHVAYFTRTVKDSAYALEVLEGSDKNDITSQLNHKGNYAKDLTSDLTNKKIAIIKEIDDLIVHEEVRKAFDSCKEGLVKRGAKIEYVNMDNTLLRAILPVYLVISCAESISNNANLDGIKFGPRESGENYQEMMFNTRTKGFSELVKRRFVIGSYCLKKQNQEKLFLRAQRIRHMIVDKVNEILKDYDAICLPASGDVAPLIEGSQGEKLSSHYLVLENHLAIANFAHLPSLTIPMGFKDNMPLGVNITGRFNDEQTVFDVSYAIEEELGLKNLIAKEGN